MVGNLGESKKRTNKNSKGQPNIEEEILPLTLDQIKQEADAKTDEISLDYEQYLKILMINDERGNKKKNTSNMVF